MRPEPFGKLAFTAKSHRSSWARTGRVKANNIAARRKAENDVKEGRRKDGHIAMQNARNLAKKVKCGSPSCATNKRT